MLSTEVTYEPGKIEVINLRDGDYAEKSELKTVGTVAEYKIIWENVKEKDADVYIGNVIAADKDGNCVPYCRDTLKCELTDDLQLIGFGSANPKDEDEDYTSDTCRLYEGRALLVVKKRAEDAVVKCKLVDVK